MQVMWGSVKVHLKTAWLNESLLKLFFNGNEATNGKICYRTCNWYCSCYVECS